MSNHASSLPDTSFLRGNSPTWNLSFLNFLSFSQVTWDVNSFASRWSPTTDKWPFTYATGYLERWFFKLSLTYYLVTRLAFLRMQTSRTDGMLTSFKMRLIIATILMTGLVQVRIKKRNSLVNTPWPWAIGHTEACTYLTLQTSAVAKTCKTNPILSEATDGTLNKLPGYDFDFLYHGYIYNWLFCLDVILFNSVLVMPQSILMPIVQSSEWLFLQPYLWFKFWNIHCFLFPSSFFFFIPTWSTNQIFPSINLVLGGNTCMSTGELSLINSK